MAVIQCHAFSSAHPEKLFDNDMVNDADIQSPVKPGMEGRHHAATGPAVLR